MSEKVEKENSMIVKAIGKSLKSSPRKTNLVLGLIRGLKVDRAINNLQFSRRRISNEILKILKSAISNAENNHQLDIDKLVVKEASAGKSMVLKRFRPRARGRAGKILKTFSRVRILVEEVQENKKEKEKLNKQNEIKKVEENGTKN